MITFIRYLLSTLASEPAVVPGTLRMSTAKATRLRERRPEFDLAGEFFAIVKRGERAKAAPRRAPFEFSLPKPEPPPRPYHASLTAIPSSFDAR